MKRITLIALLVVAAGCVAPWRVNPETGEIPLVSAAKDAITPAVKGDWVGAVLALVGGTIAGCFATKKKKDGQISQIVQGVEVFKAIESGGLADLKDALAKNMNSDTKALVDKLIDKLKK